MNTTRQCRVCQAVRPLEDFPYARHWRIHTCIDCHRKRNAEAQKPYYRNGGKAKRYAWFVGSESGKHRALNIWKMLHETD